MLSRYNQILRIVNDCQSSRSNSNRSRSFTLPQKGERGGTRFEPFRCFLFALFVRAVALVPFPIPKGNAREYSIV
jgi:hypothetical protein